MQKMLRLIARIQYLYIMRMHYMLMKNGAKIIVNCKEMSERYSQTTSLSIKNTTAIDINNRGFLIFYNNWRDILAAKNGNITFYGRNTVTS